MGRLTTDFPELIESITGERPVLRALQPGRRTMQGAEQDASAAVGRADLFDAVLALFEAMAKVAPLLLVIEDAHWADTSTRDLLSFLFSRPCDGRVAIVASYRSDDLHRRHPLRRQPPSGAASPASPGCSSSPLPPRAVRSLVKQLHPAPLRESAVAGIVARAEGNAFFVEELVGAAGCRAVSPTTSPSCCWCASTGSARPPSRSCARRRCPAAGCPTRCSPRSPA